MRNTVTWLSIQTPDPTDPPHVTLGKVHTALLFRPTIPDITPETITYLRNIMVVNWSPVTNVVLLPLFISDSMTGKTMTNVTGSTPHHAHSTRTPGMVATMMTLTDTDAVLVQLHNVIKIQVYTIGPVLASSLLKGMHTLATTDRETSISCC